MSSLDLSPSLPRGGSRARLGRAIRRCEATDSEPVATRLQPDRELRVAAGFCATQDEAVWLVRRLSAGRKLRGEQVQLLEPVDALPQRFAGVQTAWDALRPLSRRATAPLSRAMLQLGGLAGLLLCLVISLAFDLSVIETLAATGLSLLLGVGLGLMMQRTMSRAARPRRFDRVLQQRLACGEYAVVVNGVRDPAAASHVIALMRGGGLYWCAETPRRAT